MKDDAFCPYCGDEIDINDLDRIERYKNEFGQCPHWDHSNHLDEF